MKKPRPLEGVRVLDLSRLLPGPFLSLVLADLGADVVKVEAPRGGDWVRYMPPLKGGMSVQFIALNRGKRSLAIDLKKPGGADALKELVRSADVLIESFRPGVMDRLGVGYEALSAVNPRLVYAAISGYGQNGPYHQRAGHDLNYCALAGTLAMTGEAGGPPQMAGFQLADIGGGGLFGAVGVLAALHAATASGQGRLLDISMTEGAMAFNALTLVTSLHGKAEPTRGNDLLNGARSCYQTYETSDGGFMALAALEPKFWAAFCGAVDRPEWLRRHIGDDERMKGEIGALFGTKTRDEWVAVFASVDACCEPILELGELDEHPQHAARRTFFDLPVPGEEQPLRQMRTPFLDADTAAEVGPAPRLGENTREVCEQAGLSPEKIEELLNTGVLTQL